MNVHCIDSFESAVKYCTVFRPDVLDVRNNNERDDFYGLDEEDIERIQEILEQSDDDDDADDVQIVMDNQNEFPIPMKTTQKDLY